MPFLRHWFNEARRRRMFGTGAIYAVGAWVLLQVADLALESFDYPASSLRFLWIAAIAASPLALIFGWRYDITVTGIRRTPPPESGEFVDLSLKRSDFAVLAILVVVAATIAYRAIDEIRQSELARPWSAMYETSVAVLPLVSLSGDSEPEYLAAGIHDALIANLSKIRSLRVSSKTSSNIVDRMQPAPQIAEKLGVANILQGSMTREGDRIRIILQLVNAASDANIWAETFERDLSSLIAMQNEIARAVALAVQIRLSPDEQSALSTDQSIRPETYDAYLRGMFQLHKESPDGYRQGIAILTEAVENDPTSALAYAGLAYGYGKLGHSPFPVDGAGTRAREAAERALELDPNLAEAHLALGMYYLYYAWDWPAAEASLLRAIELNPSLVAAHYHYAWYLELFEDHENALKHGEITRELDPLSPFYTGWLADQYRSAGKYDEAIAEASATIEFNPNYPVGIYALGATLAEMGRFDEAIAVHERLRNTHFWSFSIASTLAQAGRRDDAQAILDSWPDHPDSAVPMIIVHGALHNSDEFFRWMAVAKQRHVPWYPWFVAWFPQVRYLKNDPRMQAIAAELKLDL